MWDCEHTIETSAPPAVLWSLFENVAGWKGWNPGIESIELRGPFQAGTEILMTPPGGDPILLRLTEVRKPEVFIDVAMFGELMIRTAHRLAPLADGKTLVTYAMQITGPGSDTIGAELGPRISGDFPEVLAALAALAEEATGR